MDTTLVVLAAGLGSRFGGNKQVSNVGPHGEILMEYSIHDAIEAGFTQIVFILKEDNLAMIRDGIGKEIAKHVRVDYAIQDASTIPAFYKIPAERVKPFGTVHAVLCAKDVIRGAFATVNADDYYGKSAFRIMHKMLCEMKTENDAGMVPYILGNTMSENGGVTRGVCHIQNGILTSVEEVKEIRFDDCRKVTSEKGELSEQEKVSMNFWGFQKNILPKMQGYFEDFLKNIQVGDVKAECLLPVMVGDFLKKNALTVHAEASEDKWFGLTYQADREAAQESLKKLHADGVYPEKLF